MIDDLRYALRQLRKNVGFAGIAVLTMGLGIGAAAAMFGLIQGVLLAPPPYANPDRLVLVSPTRVDGEPYGRGSTVGQWMSWRDTSRTIERPALYRWTFNFLVRPDGSESLGGMRVTRDYFRMLGLQPVLGREFLESEAARTDSPSKAIILGYEFWKRRFNADPGIIGTAIRISRQPAPLPVVGVMPPGVRFLPDPGNASEPNYDVNGFVDFWLASTPNEAQPEAGGWNAISRLREGATLAQAQAEIASITERQSRTSPDLDGLTAAVRPLRQELNHEARRLLVPLFGSVALLFVIACGNVASLLLARGVQRQQEYATRSALGAGRWRLFRQVLTESAALALLGAVLGAGLAVGMITLLKAIAGQAIPRSDTVTVGWWVLAFGLLAALLAAALAGVLPAIRASRPDRLHGVEGARSSVGSAERRLLGGVTTVQIVLTVALLTGAALLVRTARNLASVRPGYDTDRILAMTVTSVQPDGWEDFHTRALERVSTLPGVTHAAFVWGLPLTGNKWTGAMEIVGRAGASTLTDRLQLPLRSVTSDYFDAMGIALIDGRGFRHSDDADAPRVAVINEALARRYFAGANPMGRKMRFAGADDTIEIVGLVRNTRTEALSQHAEPEIYFPLWQRGAFSKHLILRARSDPRALGPLVRRALHAVEPTASIEHIKTMADIRQESVAPRTFAMRLLAGFALVATVLALVGIYGVLSLSVGSRTKEIAVRIAVGAQRHQILRLILGEGFRLILLGLVLGIGVAVLLGQALAALLFDATPTDPIALAAAALLFGSVALIACVVPAYRAARVDPMRALRHT